MSTPIIHISPLGWKPSLSLKFRMWRLLVEPHSVCTQIFVYTKWQNQQSTDTDKVYTKLSKSQPMLKCSKIDYNQIFQSLCANLFPWPQHVGFALLFSFIFPQPHSTMSQRKDTFNCYWNDFPDSNCTAVNKCVIGKGWGTGHQFNNETNAHIIYHEYFLHALCSSCSVAFNCKSTVRETFTRSK